jgi:4-hydroxybenzoate polyprenyltransferase
MLERYFFLADLLSLAMAISYRERTMLIVAAFVQLASLLSLLTYMYFYYQPWPALIGVLLATAALWMTFVLARRRGAEWPAISRGFAADPPPVASAERTAA